MVIRMGAGEVGPSISQLVKDVRTVMEPETAGRLKERRANRLRDYTAMAGPLGVTHLLLFSRSSSGNTNLRLGLTPRGPTLHFRVEKYSLSKDVRKAQRRPQIGGQEHLTPPLLVMNNFLNPPPADGSEPAVPRHLESLTTTVFQSLFPAISPQQTPLSSIRRVLLLNREVPTKSGDQQEGSYVLHFRHYAITTKRTGLPRSIRRLNAAEKMLSQKNSKKHNVPNLGRLDDVADFLLDPSATGAGFTSGSESEVESDAGIEVLETNHRKVLNKKQMEARRAAGSKLSERQPPSVEKRAVKLVELGPRMKLRLTKVEDGLCGGKVLWHDYLHKSSEEVDEMERVWENRQKEKEERRRIQKENIERKKTEKSKETPKDQTAKEADTIDQDDYAMDSDEDWDSEAMEEDGLPADQSRMNGIATG